LFSSQEAAAAMPIQEQQMPAPPANVAHPKFDDALAQARQEFDQVFNYMRTEITKDTPYLFVLIVSWMLKFVVWLCVLVFTILARFPRHPKVYKAINPNTASLDDVDRFVTEMTKESPVEWVRSQE
jgi:hypothetical protein